MKSHENKEYRVMDARARQKRKKCNPSFLSALQTSQVHLKLDIRTAKSTITLIRHENGAFGERSSNRRSLKTPPALRFDGDGNILTTELFKNDDVTIIT